MPYTPAFDTVETREAAWLGTDPPPGWTSSPPPNLQKANGGPFDMVQAFMPARMPRQRMLHVTRVRSAATLPEESYGVIWEWRHTIVLYIHWDFEAATGSLEDETQALMTAIAAVEQRVRGPAGDKTHGQAFMAVGVGEPRDVIDTVIAGGRPEALQQAYQSRKGLVVTMTYPAYDRGT